jgi:hypothetical protein
MQGSLRLLALYARLPLHDRRAPAAAEGGARPSREPRSRRGAAPASLSGLAGPHWSALSTAGHGLALSYDGGCLTVVGPVRLGLQAWKQGCPERRSPDVPIVLRAATAGVRALGHFLVPRSLL